MSKKRCKSKKVKGLRRYMAAWTTHYCHIPRKLTFSAKNKREASKLAEAQSGLASDLVITCLKRVSH